MHWTDQFASCGRIDALVSGKTDPHSGQPALKMSEVAVRPADMAFYGFAASRDRPDLGDADYWATARATAGYRTELAWSEAHDWEDWICTTFSCPTDVEVLSFHDARTGRHNFALFDATGLSFAVFIAPDPVLVSRQWVVDLLSDPRGNSGTRFEVLAGRPGAGRADVGATICACFSVGINTIFRAATHDGCHRSRTSARQPTPAPIADHVGPNPPHYRERAVRIARKRHGDRVMTAAVSGLRPRRDFVVCGVPRRGAMAVPDARELILASVRPIVDTIEAVLERSIGFVAAADVRSASALPRFDNSAMDGYALHAADLGDPHPLLVRGVVQAGQSELPELRPGIAIRVATGGAVPLATSAIVPDEDVEAIRDTFW